MNDHILSIVRIIMYISYIFITLTHPCEKTEASNTSSHCSCRCFDVIGVSLKTSLHSRNLPILAPQQRCGSWHRQTPDTPCITGQPTRDDQLLRLTSLGVAVASRRSPSRTGSLPPLPRTGVHLLYPSRSANSGRPGGTTA